MPPLMSFPQAYWGVVGTTIAIACIANVTNYFIYRQRIWAASKRSPDPSRPKSLLAETYATLTAVTREASNASLTSVTISNWHMRFPTLGKTSLIVANIILIVALGLYGFDTRDRWSMENIGYRTGFVTISQIPLIFLLAGKNNIIGYLTGLGYERLNWLHRWTARCLLFSATIHMGYWFTAWAPYGGFIERKIRTDPLTQRGLIAWCILLWIVISSIAPIRGWRYEIFVAQHIISIGALIGVLMIHTPKEVHIFLWLPVAFFFFDRVARILRVLYLNLSIFHPKQRRSGAMNSAWACRAELTPLAPDHTRLTIRNPPMSWRPGQHVYLSCHSIAPLQSHPFSIASLPSDGKMDFVIRARTGGTRRLHHVASKDQQAPILPTAETKERTDSQSDQVSLPITIESRMAAIEGPYGIMRPPEQFDSLVLFAGSTGATFCVPIIRDVVRRWSAMHSASPTSHRALSIYPPDIAATRRIRFIWAVKSRHQLAWFCSQLCDAKSEVESLRANGVDVQLDVSVCCTCDDEYVGEHRNLLQSLGHFHYGEKRPEPKVTHGEVKQVQPAASDGSLAVDEKSALKKGIAPSDGVPVQVHEVDSQSSDNDQDPQSNTGGCGPSGCCCCAPTDASAPSEFVCRCGITPADSESRPSSAEPPKLTKSSTSPSLHPSINLATGRPTPEPIIRAVLEKARGETGVLACGPLGMMDGVRGATVRLSDERAVHKGTGAQGIWYYGEGFGW
ncbi:hypothetical protein P152DRAFT_466528 [Eremomyces bilateralis CBS 781.70]|uniref:ferric-chelate reductase (NADPH) n=1 Tax=Eremomyces bilateralis CBS 781.70 TaxID=1392243 RepID=A0A6G1G3N1_9PEZI|nr:uncharacterized protein P152DRAFT_466528 [Eremomyces bilateralis CBS 781.70]KAF1812674.1 hypothetical protein P152DRAFT_466528 [Eremomyces bilateralis CBS 781.70]